MNPIEFEIISKIVSKALANGYFVSVYDGGEWPVRRSSDPAEILAATATTDETHYLIRNTGGYPIGSIWFVHGNEEDVVSDCSDTPLILELIE